MIGHLRGTLLEKDTRYVLIENGGVGYEVLIPLSTFYAFPEEAEEVALHIHTHVREDALTLFGFMTRMEKALFLLLISVSGIGPRLALNILSGIGPEELLQAMASGDAPRLQTIPGVGKKTAERIALELKDRALKLQAESGCEGRVETPPAAPEERAALEDAVSALMNLGYPEKSAKPAVDRAAKTGGTQPLERLIKESLKLLLDKR